MGLVTEPHRDCLLFIGGRQAGALAVSGGG
jgi:hypothetical protein